MTLCSSAFLKKALPPCPPQVLVGLNKRQASCFDMYSLELASGQLTLVAENPGDVISWLLDYDFKLRACTAMNPEDGSTILRVRDDPQAPWRWVPTQLVCTLSPLDAVPARFPLIEHAPVCCWWLAPPFKPLSLPKLSLGASY